MDRKKVLEVWVDRFSHNIPLLQSLIQRKTLTFFNSLKADGGEEAAEAKLEGSRGWVMRFKGKSCLYHIKTQSEAAMRTQKLQLVCQMW